MRHDTCALIAVSLNLSQRTHPVVWSLNNLPFDCSQVLAVPKPIGEYQLFLYLTLNNLMEQSTLQYFDGVIKRFRHVLQHFAIFEV